jgi:hypothetical protein
MDDDELKNSVSVQESDASDDDVDEDEDEWGDDDDLGWEDDDEILRRMRVLAKKVKAWDGKNIYNLLELTKREQALADKLNIGSRVDMTSLPWGERIPDALCDYPMWTVDADGRALVGEAADEVQSLSEIVEYYESKLLKKRMNLPCRLKEVWDEIVAELDEDDIVALWERMAYWVAIRAKDGQMQRAVEHATEWVDHERSYGGLFRE